MTTTIRYGWDSYDLAAAKDLTRLRERLEREKRLDATIARDKAALRRALVKVEVS